MRRLAVVVAVLLTLLTAVSAVPAQQLVPVRIGYIPVAGGGQIFVIDGEGWARAAGLELKLTQFDSGPNAIQGLASGTIDVYAAGIGPLAVARLRGVDVRVVTATAIEELAFVAGGKLAAQFGQGGSAADAFARFSAAAGRPAKLATQPAGSVPNTVLQHWLWEVAKVKRGDVEIVPMGIDATQQALLAGAVDGATIREPAITIVRDRDPSMRLVAPGGEMFRNQPGGVVAFSGRFIESQPQASQALVDLIVRATQLLQTDPSRAAPHIQAALGRGIVDLETMRRALSSQASRFVADPRLIIDPTRRMQDYQVQIGVLDRPVPLDGLFDPSFYEKAVNKRP
jgi:NitT/TauT family transport system substrate-binding protein